MKPIVFSTPMVQAILEGRKTQARRVVKPQPILRKGLDLATLNDVIEENFWHWKDCQWLDGGLGFPQSGIDDYAPYQPGDVLWVRETWAQVSDFVDTDPDVGCPDGFIYKADWNLEQAPRWRSPIHMPCGTARIFLRVTDVRVERVQDISYDNGDIWAEGIPAAHDRDGETRSFVELWDSINAKRGHSWESDPWVWVYEFERVEGEDDNHER